MRFVQLMPDHLTDARTYNMLVTVCIAAKDLPQALHAGMMMRNTGRSLDTYLYTNLITGKPMPLLMLLMLDRFYSSAHHCTNWQPTESNVVMFLFI